MKKSRAVLYIFLILIILFYGSIYVINNLIAKRLEHQLLDCPLPSNSELIDSASVTGKILGNGNGMQYFGIILIVSEMNENELLQWYNGRVNTKETDEIHVIKQETSEIFENSNYHFNHYSGEGHCFQIQIFRNIAGGTEASIWESLLNCDLRGH